MPSNPGAIDPVCGMTVDPSSAPASVEHEGKTYYFCCPHCAQKFRADPERYLLAGAQPEHDGMPPSGRQGPRSSTSARWTRKSSAIVRGAAPSAAWPWSRASPATDEGPNPELVDMRRRFWVGLVLTVPLIVLHMAHLCRTSALAAIGCWPRRSCSGAAWPFWVRAVLSVVRMSPNMFTLIALGVGAAYGYSLAALRGRRRWARDCISRRRRRSSCWCCSARCWSCGRAAKRHGQSGGCSAWRRRRPDSSGPTAAKRTCRLNWCRSATWCACGPARRCRSMASSSRAAVPSMRR